MSQAPTPVEPEARPSPIDPANQSIADALRITFALVKLGMLVLLVLYVLSGFQFVKEGERGIRLLFGKIEDARIEPGFRFSWPFPLGEMKRITLGDNEVRIDDVFWQKIEAGTPSDKPYNELPPQNSLKPDVGSGSLLTADGNIAHAQVSVHYRRANPAQYTQNIDPGAEPFLDREKQLVRLAVQRGIVHAAAQTTIDELLKQTSGQAGGTTAQIARALAQQLLDEQHAGIVIDSVTLDPKPPRAVFDDFAKVQAAVSNAAKAIEEARLAARQQLNAAAGAAAVSLVAAIDEYEQALARRDEPAQKAALARVDQMLDSGHAKDGSGDVLVTGEAARLMSEARQYRSEVVARRRGEHDTFLAKLEQFRSNPDVMVRNEWASALAEFYAQPNVDTFFVAPGMATTILNLNRDPDVAREVEKAIKEKQTEDTRKLRLQEAENARFKTNTEGTMSR